MKFKDLKRYPDLEAAIYAYHHTPVLSASSAALRDLEAFIAERETEARKQPLGSLVSYFEAQKEMFEQNPQVRSVYAEAEGLVRAFTTREPIQERIARWLTETLSEESEEAGLSPLDNREERAVRFVEEALELAQAIGVDRDQLHRLVDYVMNRPVGEVAQEIGGSMLTLYAVSAACGVDADAQAMKEVKRVETPEIRAKVRRRQKEKRAALVTNDVPRRGRAQQHWVSQVDFEELQKLADDLEKENERTRCDYDKLKDERDQLEKENERLRDRKHWVALEDVNELQNRADKVENENQRLRQHLDCGLDCEEHSVIELALAECAPTEEERDAYMERAPAELPDLVKEWRATAQRLSARVASLIAQRDQFAREFDELSAKHDDLTDVSSRGVFVGRGELKRLLEQLERHQAHNQKLQQRGTELVNEARDARIERDALLAAGKSSEAQQEIDHLTKQLSDAWRSIAELEDQALASSNASPSPCAMGKYCSKHEFTHGAEAEELREKLAVLCARLEKIPSPRIGALLDEVDARDSLAYLEFRDDEGADDDDKLNAVDRISKQIAQTFDGLFGPKPEWHDRTPTLNDPVAASLDSRHYIEQRSDGKYVAVLDNGRKYVVDDEEDVVRFDTVDEAKAAVLAKLREGENHDAV